jgi:SSS family solute:Na+ symporter
MVQRGSKVGINFEAEEKWSVPDGILAMLLGTVFIYSALFSVGYWIYGNWTWAIVLTIVVLASGISLSMIWNKIKRVVK